MFCSVLDHLIFNHVSQHLVQLNLDYKPINSRFDWFKSRFDKKKKICLRFWHAAFGMYDSFTTWQTVQRMSIFAATWQRVLSTSGSDWNPEKISDFKSFLFVWWHFNAVEFVTHFQDWHKCFGKFSQSHPDSAGSLIQHSTEFWRNWSLHELRSHNWQCHKSIPPLCHVPRPV